MGSNDSKTDLVPLVITGQAAISYLNEVLSRENQRIGLAILANQGTWNAWAILPKGTTVKRATRFDAGGIIYSTYDSFVWLSKYCNENKYIRSLLWEDPWLHESDLEHPGFPKPACFHYGGCAYCFFPILGDEITPDEAMLGARATIAYPGCLFLSETCERDVILDANAFVKTIVGICIFCYDQEGFVLYEKSGDSR